MRITIKMKLIALVTLPLLILSYLTYLNINNQYKHLNEIQKIPHLNAYSKTISEVVYSLQKERDLATGYIHTKESYFKTEFEKQTKISKAKELLVYANDFVSPSQQEILNQFHTLVQIRLDIQNSNIDSDKVYKFYSSFIAILLGSIENSDVELENKNIRMLFLATQNIEHYEEFLAQERGYLNIVFNQESIVSSKIENFLNIIYKQNVMYTQIESDLKDSPYLEQFKALKNDKILKNINTYRNTIFKLQNEKFLLSQLQRTIGYGGLVHHFKNYLLRFETRYYDKFMQDYQTLKKITTDYRNNVKGQNEKLEYLNAITKMFDTYHDNINIVKKRIDNAETIHDK